MSHIDLSILFVMLMEILSVENLRYYHYNSSGCLSGARNCYIIIVRFSI